MALYHAWFPQAALLLKLTLPSYAVPDGAGGPDPPWKVKSYRFLFSNTSPDPVENHIASKPAFNEGAQWLSGRVLDSRPKSCGFEHHRRHSVVSLSKAH